MTFGERIRRTRDAKGIKQNECAKMTGISRTQMGNLESPRDSNPGAETISRLAEALEVDSDWLLGRGTGEGESLLNALARMSLDRYLAGLPNPNEPPIALERLITVASRPPQGSGPPITVEAWRNLIDQFGDLAPRTLRRLGLADDEN